MIPLIDCSDNDFIVYHFDSKTWSKFNIIDECVFKEKESLDELLKKYSNSDVVTQIESNLNTYSSQEIDLNDIVLSSFVNKKFYNMDLLYNDEIDIKNYGIVEPLLIFRSNKNNKYLLLNGTKRYLILKKLHTTILQTRLSKQW